MNITRSKLLVGTFITGVAAILLPSAQAVAYSSPPLELWAEAQSPATVQGKGVMVSLPIDYSCTGTGMSLNIQLLQKAGNGIASGYGYGNVSCDGATHRTQVAVTPNAEGRVFSSGPATARVEVWGCHEFYCGNDVFIKTVSLKK
ncbi:MAG: hypothetical protein QG671_3598 [Actinomycetota bacterium]|nr:hypothetical protein [Actinomycetota bacterium]